MKNLLLTLTFITMALFTSCEDDHDYDVLTQREIEALFPDSAFRAEILRVYASDYFDYKLTWNTLTNEQTVVDIRGEECYSIDGVKAMRNVVRVALRNTSVGQVDLSGLKNIHQVQINDNSKLRYLDISDVKPDCLITIKGNNALELIVLPSYIDTADYNFDQPNSKIIFK